MRTRFSVYSLPVLFAATLLAIDAASAFELHVNSTTDAIDANPGDGVCASLAGECTLRAAIQEANSHPGLDKVILGPGHHLLTIPGVGEDNGATGDLDVAEPILITGAGIAVTVIDAVGLDRVLDVLPSQNSNNSLAVEDLTIRGGAASASIGTSGGAGVLIQYSFAISVLDGVELRENEAQGMGFWSGSAIYANAPVLIRDSSIVRNVGGTALVVHEHQAIIDRTVIAENEGDAILHFSYGSQLQLIDSAVRENGGAAGTFGEAGADVDNCVIERNASGLSFGSDTISTIRNSTIRDNLGTGLSPFAGSAANLDVADSTVSGNLGGGIAALCDVILTLENSTISGNSATRGGGLLLSNPFECGGVFVAATNVTITANSADEGGGVAIDGGDWFAMLSVRDSVIADNEASADPDCTLSGNSTVSSGGHNLVGSGTGCSWVAASGDLVGSDAGPLDPGLGPLADNGGFAPTHALLPGSPAIDAIPSETCLPNDQRGVARPQGNGCDIGALESNACANGVDEDGDSLIDYPADPGCKDATSTREHAQCQDGLDNDNDGKVDFDGGASVNGGVPIATIDPQCADKPWRASEAASGTCGLGAELVLMVGALRVLRQRTRRRAARD